MFTPGSRACRYKPASGRGKWLNQDPIQEWGGINLYGFVANAPLTFVDIWGLADVSIYDPNDKGGSGIADGKCFKFGAQQTGSIVIPVKDPADAAKKLKDLQKDLAVKGETITKLSIWDHGSPGSQELGTKSLEPKSKDWKDIASTVDPKGRIDLYGCEVCQGKVGQMGIQDLANEGGRTVTGCDATTDFEYNRGPFWIGRFNQSYDNSGKRYILKPQTPPTTPGKPAPTPKPQYEGPSSW